MNMLKFSSVTECPNQNYHSEWMNEWMNWLLIMSQICAHLLESCQEHGSLGMVSTQWSLKFLWAHEGKRPRLRCLARVSWSVGLRTPFVNGFLGTVSFNLDTLMDMQPCAFGDAPPTKQNQRLVLATWGYMLLREGRCRGLKVTMNASCDTVAASAQFLLPNPHPHFSRTFKRTCLGLWIRLTILRVPNWPSPRSCGSSLPRYICKRSQLDFLEQISCPYLLAICNQAAR